MHDNVLMRLFNFRAITNRLILLVTNIDYKQVYLYVWLCLDGGYNGVSIMKTGSTKKISLPRGTTYQVFCTSQP